MSNPQPLEVKVIYSASSRRRRRRGVRVSRSSPRGPRRTGLFALALLNLAAAGGLYHWTWWKVDPEIYLQLSLQAEIPNTVIRPAADATDAAISALENPFAVTAPAGSAVPLVSKRQMVIVGSAYGWLTLATLSAIALAMSGAMLLERFLGSWLRWVGLAATVVGVCAAAWVVLDVAAKAGWGFKVSEWRQGMGGLVVLAALVGLSIGDRSRGFTRLAALLLILLGAGSAGGLYLLSRFDALSPERSTPMFLAGAFIVHALWGFILIPLASRILRSA